MNKLTWFVFLFIHSIVNAQFVDSVRIIDEFNQVGNEINKLKYIIQKSNVNQQVNLDTLLQVNNRSYNKIECLQQQLGYTSSSLDSANKQINDLIIASNNLEKKNKNYYLISFILFFSLVIALIILIAIIISYRQKTITHILNEAEKHSGQNQELLLQINDFKSLNESIKKYIRKAKKEMKDKKKKK